MEEMKDRITRMQLSDKVYFAGATDDVNDYLCCYGYNCNAFSS
jgi:hypothetical protein